MGDGLIRVRGATVAASEAGPEAMAATLRRLLEASRLLGLAETEAQLRLALLTLCAEAASPLH